MRSPLTILVMALLTAAFLWPPEDAVNGGGLHLVILWLMAGGLLGARYFMALHGGERDRPRRARFGLADLAVLMILVGHVLSTIYVFSVEGDRRSALNLTFEWAGLFAAWRVLRHLTLDRLQSVQIHQLITTISVGLAVMGIWQHHVFYPEQAAWYQSERAKLDSALEEPNGAGLFRVSEIVAQFQSQGIPLEGTDRVLWENRLLSSSEPFATFSLANTLAGVLATSFVFVVGQFVARLRTTRAMLSSVALFLQAAVILYCLVLTKSRSAWAGALVGLMTITLLSLRTSAARRILQWAFPGVACAGLIVGLAVFSGALDKEVILESSRSMQFRMYYWMGAMETLKEAPLTGAGPGNFRQEYLRHKADESSEEIRDPHNFLLESWSAGGVVGFAGLLLFIGALYQRSISADLTHQEDPDDIAVPKKHRFDVMKSIMLGALIHSSWQWVNGYSIHHDFVERLLPLSGSIFCLMGRGRSPQIDRSVGVAASLTMMVHLLAAGGFEMPVVVLVVLITAMLGQADVGVVVSQLEPSYIRRYWMVPGVVVSLLAGLVVLRFGLMSVSGCERYLLLGDDLFHRQGNPREALVAYRTAAEEDAFAVLPRQKIAELTSYTLRMESQLLLRLLENHEKLHENQVSIAEKRAKVQSEFEKSVEACDAWILQDKRNSFSYRLKAECLFAGSVLEGHHERSLEAIELQQWVIAMYPSSVAAWMQLFRYCREYLDRRVSDPGVEEVLVAATERVRQLDEINHQWGHRDRYLTEEDLKLLAKPKVKPSKSSKQVNQE